MKVLYFDDDRPIKDQLKIIKYMSYTSRIYMHI